jgi:integrase
MLTEIAIRNLKPKADRYEKPDGNGLYVVVQPTGAKSFAVRFRGVDGKPKKLTLDKGLTLAEARAAAATAILAVHRGTDPTAAKRKGDVTPGSIDTLRTVVETYFKRDGGKLRSAAWQRRIFDRHVLPELGDMPISAITRKAVNVMLDKVEDRSGAPMAHMVLALLRRIMGWWEARDENFRSPIVRAMARIKESDHARDRILDDDELRAIWTAAESAGTFGRYARFLLLTGCRRSEASRMTWGELKDGVWTLPAVRNKVGKQLERPLSKAALALLDEQPRVKNCAYIFTTTGKGALANIARNKAALDAAAGVSNFTIHDLRRTSRSLMSRAGIPSDHAERCLGHVIGGVRGVYDKHKYQQEMAHAYEQLAALIQNITSPPGNNVRALRG